MLDAGERQSVTSWFCLLLTQQVVMFPLAAEGVSSVRLHFYIELIIKSI
jgi:hypothetical protein